MKQEIFSLQAVINLLRSEGAKRVSKNAAIKLRKALEEYGRKLGKKAVKNALLDGRKTIKKEDIDKENAEDA